MSSNSHPPEVPGGNKYNCDYYYYYYIIIILVADPPRFSCGVTGDEIKVSGVVVYDECTVNTNKMMNLVSGNLKRHARHVYIRIKYLRPDIFLITNFS